MQEMLNYWLDLLATHGWELPLEEITWATTDSDDTPGAITIRATCIRRAPRAVGFKALGCEIPFDNLPDREFDARCDKPDAPSTQTAPP